MKLPPFQLEEFWKSYEFSAPHLLCCSDAESWRLEEILQMADEETKEQWDSLTLGYTEVPGLPQLRKEIAKLYSKIDEEQLFTFAGAEEGIYCSLRALLEPEDHVIVIEPCYQSLKTLPSAFGATVSTITLHFEQNWELDLAKLEKLFSKKTKLIILNLPHNPTGSLLSQESLARVIELATEHESYIFCDEVYRFLEIDENDRLPSIADAYEKGISLNVMTKSFGLAGLRIGWVAASDKSFMESVSSYKLYTSICNSAPSEILALIALRSKEKILERNRNIVSRNLKLMESFMERHHDYFRWCRPKSGTITAIKLLPPFEVAPFFHQLIEKEGILVMPGSVTGLPQDFFRIGFGRSNFPQTLDRFETFVKRELK